MLTSGKTVLLQHFFREEGRGGWGECGGGGRKCG